MAKKLSDYIPIFADQGIDYVSAAPAAGVATQYQVIAASGVGTNTITLEHQMANTDYAVCISQEDGNNAYLESASKTVTGFNVNDGWSAASISIVVIGQLKGQK
ncbi:MAG: hypothetical protein CME17_01050 [Gemmatimonadetes bacterium]|nr:hypothetical protein [Gemmatimonadota bacterium]|tara:strand:- start:736 stop:1047 length:312 start_codon:yes stop_codon:yes gene_type:complete